MLKKLLALLVMLYAVACLAGVDVNKASVAELDSVKGIGPGTSGKILDERKKGSFKDWDDFIGRVKGIGQVNAAKFSAEGLTVNGEPFKAVAAQPKASKEDKKAEAKAVKEDKKAQPAPAAASTPAQPVKPAVSAASAAKK